VEVHAYNSSGILKVQLEERQRLLATVQGEQQVLAERLDRLLGESREHWRLAEAEHLLAGAGEPNALPRRWVTLFWSQRSSIAESRWAGMVESSLIIGSDAAQCDLCLRAGMCGIQTWLSFFCKSPMHDFEHEPVHDLFQQWRMVKETLRNMVGETAPSYLD
jgi:hypothetical protein